MNIKSGVVVSWQGLLNQVVNLVGHGYHYIHVTRLPITKKEKWNEITLKIMGKYNAELTKDQRYQRKKKGLANFYLLRWEHVLVLLHTEGNVIVSDELAAKIRNESNHRDFVITGSESGLNPKQVALYQVQYDDLFTDVRFTPVEIQTGEEAAFEILFIQKDIREKIEPKNDQKQSKKTKQKKKQERGKIIDSKDQATVKLSRQFIRNKKAELAELIAAKKKDLTLRSFDMLNNFPAHRGIILQKKEIQEFIIEQGQIHGVKFTKFELYIVNNRDTSYKIFKI